MRVSTNSPLATDGKTAVINHLRQQLRRPLDETFVQFELDNINAVLTVHSLERSTSGVYGRYSGSEMLSYQKVPLETCLPYSIPYRGEYPCSFAVLRGWLEQHYGLVLDPGELAIAATTVPLIDSSIVNIALNPATNVLLLDALPSSARFTTGSQLKITMIPSNGKQWLPGLVPSVLLINANLLTQTTLQNRSTLYPRNFYNSTAKELAVELLWRGHGYDLDINSTDVSVSSNDPSIVNVILTARSQAIDGSRSAYNGTTTFRYQKVPMASVIPHDLVFDGAYPVTFSRLQQYLRYAYDLIVEEGQFRLEGGPSTGLVGATVIDSPANADGEIVLVALNSSVKWVGGSRLRLRLV